MLAGILTEGKKEAIEGSLESAAVCVDIALGRRVRCLKNGALASAKLSQTVLCSALCCVCEAVAFFLKNLPRPHFHVFSCAELVVRSFVMCMRISRFVGTLEDSAVMQSLSVFHTCPTHSHDAIFAQAISCSKSHFVICSQWVRLCCGSLFCVVSSRFRRLSCGGVVFTSLALDEFSEWSAIIPAGLQGKYRQAVAAKSGEWSTGSSTSSGEEDRKTRSLDAENED